MKRPHLLTFCLLLSIIVPVSAQTTDIQKAAATFESLISAKELSVAPVKLIPYPGYLTMMPVKGRSL